MGRNAQADLVRKQGTTYQATKRTRSDIYSEFLPLANSGLVELLDHDRTIKQLLALERRTSAAGKDSIDHWTPARPFFRSPSRLTRSPARCVRSSMRGTRPRDRSALRDSRQVASDEVRPGT